jgi:hypothetical protein
MDKPQEFEILIRRRIPYVSSTLFGMCFLFFAVLFVLDVIMLPTKNASQEMATAYYILVVPEWLKTASAYSGLGLLIVAPLYYSARLHKPAKLIIHQDHLLIVGKQIDLNIPARKIDKVFCNDLHNLFRRSKGILQFVLKQKRRKVTTFRLKHYDQGEEVLSQLINLENIQFAFYVHDMIGNHQDE